MKRLFNVKQFARRLGISEGLARKWLRLGKVQAVKLSRCTRIREEELDRIIADGLPAARSQPTLEKKG